MISEKSIVIGVTADKKYHKYANVLINSAIYHNGAGVDISYHCVGFTPTNNYPSQVTVTVDSTPLSKKKTYFSRGIDEMHPRMKTLRGRLCSEHSIYTAHYKYTHLINLYKKYRIIIIVDADTIIRGNLSDLIAVESNQRHLMMKAHYNKNRFIDTPILSEGFIYVDTINNDILTFFEAVVEHLKAAKMSGEFDMDSDTQIISKLFWGSKISDSSTFLPLPDKYKDATLDDSSCVWSGQGNAKETAKYEAEMKKYESICYNSVN